MNHEEKCLALDKQLAELLGWHRLYMSDIDGSLCGDFPFKNWERRIVPRWTQDDAEALRLAVEHACYPCKWDDESIACGVDCPVLDIKSFPNVYACVRYAIVQAVIDKLKG